MFASCIPDLIASVGAVRHRVRSATRAALLRDRSRLPTWSRGRFPSRTRRPMESTSSRRRPVCRGSCAATRPPFRCNSRYLAACPQKRARWRERFAQLGGGLKVGIAWRGGGTPFTKRRRSTMLAQWSSIFHVPGVRFINLQYGDCAAELAEAKSSLGVELHHWNDADPLEDLDDFAAQIAELDLVISVDSATVTSCRGARRSGLDAAAFCGELALAARIATTRLGIRRCNSCGSPNSASGSRSLTPSPKV